MWSGNGNKKEVNELERGKLKEEENEGDEDDGFLCDNSRGFSILFRMVLEGESYD